MSVPFHGAASDKLFESVVEACENLTELDLSNSMMNDDAMLLLARVCPQLQSLDVSDSPEIGDEGIVAIARGCPQLRKLAIGGPFELTDVSLVALGRGCPQLEALKLTECMDLTDEGLAAIAEGCPSLSTLELHVSQNISDAGLASVANGCPRLRKLCVRMCPISNAGIAGIVEKCKDLRHLELNIDGLDDDALIGVGTHGTALRTLKLWSGLFTDSGVAAIARGLVCLEDLTLSWSYRSRITAVSLESISSGLPSLKYFRVDRDKSITEDVIKELQRKRPRVQVLSLYD